MNNEKVINQKLAEMELVATTPEKAKEILDSGKRKIVTESGRSVRWINLNNYTLSSEKDDSARMENIEDVKLYIQVPRNAKTVY